MENISHSSKPLSAEQRDALMSVLKTRFEKNMKRHSGLEWGKVQTKLETDPAKLWSLNQMEQTGGEPDVVGFDPQTGEYIFYDCSAETPLERRNLCYDRAALDARKTAKPGGSAVEMAEAMGIEMLSEDEYRNLQKLSSFDAKTSSWLKTPAEMRKLDGALFGDFRFGRVFVYHNGASSYYSARGFRGSLRV